LKKDKTKNLEIPFDSMPISDYANIVYFVGVFAVNIKTKHINISVA